MTVLSADLQSRVHLLYHFCRLQLPPIGLLSEVCERHLERTFNLYRAKVKPGQPELSWEAYLDNLYPLDWFVVCACLEGNSRAWEYLFAARAGRSDCLLTDALRARAARLYPRNEERQENAVQEFWGHLYVSEHPGSLPVLARYDGQRPLVPWLIRVFQNWQISGLRAEAGLVDLPPVETPCPPPTPDILRWHEPFAEAVREWLAELNDRELLILGLRLRYRMTQREVAALLEVHEGTVSRKTDSLRDNCLGRVSERLLEAGWTGDDLGAFVRTEMYNLLLDDPRLSVDHLAHLLAAQGRQLPQL